MNHIAHRRKNAYMVFSERSVAKRVWVEKRAKYINISIKNLSDILLVDITANKCMYKHSIQNALEAIRSDKIMKWVQEYLTTEGSNQGLAKELEKAKPEFVKLIEFPLSKLVRIMGPEQTMIYVEPIQKWEERVEKIIEDNIGEIQLPPIIITDLWKMFEIADGNHRHEALLRMGLSKYWTLFLFTKKENLKDLV